MSAPASRGQALVTGASSGIGLAIARRLNESGFSVVGVSRRAVSAEGVESRPLDLADLDALTDQLGVLRAELGTLEVLVLAAGAGRFGTLEQQSPDQIRALVDLNLTANLLICRSLLPVLKRRGRGTVVFIGSEAGLAGKRQGSVYCATKFGVRGLAQALRDECAASGVSVSVIQPGMVRTPFFDEQDFEPGPASEHALEPSDVADAVAHVIDTPPHAVIDEFVLSPRLHVVQKKQGHKSTREERS